MSTELNSGVSFVDFDFIAMIALRIVKGVFGPVSSSLLASLVFKIASRSNIPVDVDFLVSSSA